MPAGSQTTSEKQTGMRQKAEEEANSSQLRKLKIWTSKPFPIDLRPDYKTPFLHQFTCAQLREGLVHAITARKAFEAELNNLLEIQQQQYAIPEHEATFATIRAKMKAELGIEYDNETMIDNETLEAEDHGTAIREWESGFGFEDARMLRYTVSVVSRTNWKMRGLIREMEKAVGRAQGDV